MYGEFFSEMFLMFPIDFLGIGIINRLAVVRF